MWLSLLAPAEVAVSALSQPWRTVSRLTARSVSRIIPAQATFLPPTIHSRGRYISDACASNLVKVSKGASVALATGSGHVDNVETVKNVLDMANRAMSRGTIFYTDFFNPFVLKESKLALEKLVDVKVVSHGGYPEAERCRLSIGHQDAIVNEADVVAAVSIAGNFRFQPFKHGDFLGSILGTGIVREKVGDIILQGEKGAQMLIVPELVDFIILSMDKVGNVPVSCVKIPLDDIEYEAPVTKNFKTIESSTRLDALASAGFKVSRTKLSDLIKKGDVRVNWNTVLKTGTTLKSGDLVSVSGMGRLKIGEISTTKKGKYAAELIRYL